MMFPSRIALRCSGFASGYVGNSPDCPRAGLLPPLRCPPGPVVSPVREASPANRERRTKPISTEKDAGDEKKGAGTMRVRRDGRRRQAPLRCRGRCDSGCRSGASIDLPWLRRRGNRRATRVGRHDTTAAMARLDQARRPMAARCTARERAQLACSGQGRCNGHLHQNKHRHETRDRSEGHELTLDIYNDRPRLRPRQGMIVRSWIISASRNLQSIHRPPPLTPPTPPEESPGSRAVASSSTPPRGG